MKKPIVLIVDDMELNRAMLAETVKKDFEIMEAENGLVALDVLKEHHQDVGCIILDLLMSVMDGIEFLKEVSKNDNYSCIPTIIVTASETEEDTFRAFDYGAMDVLAKPYDAKIILRRIQNLVRMRDINNLKQELEHLKEVNQDRIRLQAILDNIVGGIVVAEIGETVKALYINKGFSIYSGLTEQELEKHKGDLLFRVNDARQKQLMYKLAKNIEMGEVHNSFEYSVLKTDGTIGYSSAEAVRIEYPDSDKPVLLVIVTDITKIKRHALELQYRDERDNLTGVYNRRAFCSYAKEMLDFRQDEKFYIVVTNIINFRTVNEILGETKCDEMLKMLAKAFQTYVFNQGIVGRLQGDNFVLCISKNQFNAQLLLDTSVKILADFNMKNYINIDFGVYEIGADETEVAIMCDRAMLTVRNVKSDYGSRILYFDDELQKSLQREKVISSQMEKALENGEFKVYAQPIYSLKQSKAVGAEILVRWIKEDGTIVMPNDFISYFEKCGFITRLDEYMWTKACEYLQHRIENNMEMFSLSVNLSRKTLYIDGSSERLLEIRKKHGIYAKLLGLEITETAYNINNSQLLDTVKAVRTEGVKVYMDDFGSGLSSLTMLKDLPIDVLKLDMSFMRDFQTSTDARVILSSVIELAQKLNMAVVAEGVETREQMDYLSKLGCDRIQGYYFSRPVPIEQLDETMKKNVEF